ncbi:ATP-dependent helicase [Candidatus Atribacteria bacterium HGW-Atribacteria-1]|nr:MAG: ATP-dependent helicase [Candidatus Atribacteria bacterium HGW-Atribacteria-1]
MTVAIEIIDEIKDQIKAGNNFLVSGGAGSGKTYTLVQVLDLIYDMNPLTNIACITFTNIAADEIKQRSKYDILEVSTIHDFLWKSIRNYQNDLKKSLVALIEQEKKEEESGIKYSGEIDINKEYLRDKEINYKDYKKIDEGILSHDEILKISNYMFKTYPLLCNILKDKYDYILIDEYQDTEKQVIDIFLEYLPKSSSKKNVISFFGDSMQSIYRDRVGNLQGYIAEGLVKEIKKDDNWRCSETVIELLNKIRTDGIQQKRKIKPDEVDRNLNGRVTFIYSNTDTVNIEDIKRHKIFEDWDSTDFAETKELYLTHNLIAGKAGFGDIFKIYNNDEIIKHVKKIKRKLKDENRLADVEGKIFSEVLDLKIVNQTNNFDKFTSENSMLFENAKSILFEKLTKIYLDSDQLIGDNRDKLITHLLKIQERLHLYNSKKVNEFVKKTDYKILSVGDKKKLKESIETLVSMKEQTIEEVVNFADDKNIAKKDDNINNFVKENTYIYDRVKQLPFEEIINLYNFEEDLTPYSTQHGIKGAEFDNVFVILDNGKWNQYNFKYLFEETSGKESIIERTKKMFYVCCSRAKNNLVVFYHKPSSKVLDMAQHWFEKDNVIDANQ